MMTLEQIQKCSLNDLNYQYIQEVHSQAEKRLIDSLDTKKQFEKKALILLSGGIITSIVFFTIAQTLFMDNKSIPFVIAGIGMVTSSVSFLNSLRGSPYGCLGSMPNMWIKKEYFKNDNGLKAMITYIAFYLQEKIDKSIKSNKKKALFIEIGLILWMCSLILFTILVIVSLYF